MTALADLLAPQTAEQVFSTLLGTYQANNFPVQSWQPFGTERTRLMAFATALVDVSGGYIPQAAGGGFLDYASTNWLRLTAVELYNIVYNTASATQGTMALVVPSGAGPYTFAAGSLIAVFAASGRRYINVNAGTLPVGPSATPVLFRAEFAGASYNDSSNANPLNSGLLTLATPLPGVWVNNPAGTWSNVGKVGSGTGTITPSGSPTIPHQTIVRIDTSGASGAAAWSYSLDGAPFISVGAIASAVIGGTGITVTLTNGTVGTSFVIGDTLTFSNPGTWVTAQGSDDESDLALAQRCKNRWSTLSPIPTNSFYQLLATSTPGVGSQVTQVIVIPDSVVNNQVNIVVAGPAGVLPTGTVAAIQAYVNPRVPITDRPMVVSPTTQVIDILANITVYASQRAAASVAANIALTDYIYSVGINGTLRLAAVIDLLMNIAGVIDVSGVTINFQPSNLTLGSPTTFVLPVVENLILSYITV